MSVIHLGNTAWHRVVRVRRPFGDVNCWEQHFAQQAAAEIVSVSGHLAMVAVVRSSLSETPSRGFAVSAIPKAMPELSQSPWKAFEVYSVPSSART